MVTTLAVSAISAGAASIAGQVPVVAAIGIGVGLLAFGIRYLVHTFKRTAN